MKCQTENKVYIPEYALSYLINGDASGLEPEDITAVDNWLNGYLSTFKSVVNYVINLNSETADFFNRPEFGLAANCFDCSVSVMYN